MLVLTELTKNFGGFRAVHHCSFEVAEGSITGLIGPNGAGKPTRFNPIAGALWPDTGRVEFSGDDLPLPLPHRRFPLGLVRTFTMQHDIPRLPVLEHLMDSEIVKASSRTGRGQYC